MIPMRDDFGRKLSYLRVSVTDRCNLRCQYCMPAQGIVPMDHAEILRYEEIVRVVRVMAGLGVERVRLTGGEPLVRKNIAEVAHRIKTLPGIRFLGLTTNGVHLYHAADELLRAGVDGINISLDTTDPSRYAAITRKDAFTDVMNGLSRALSLGFGAVKINCVLFPDAMVDDWLGVVELAKTRPVDVRLIEWMPIGGAADAPMMSADAALDIISRRFGVPQELPSLDAGAGPAKYWQIPGFAGRLGIIRAMSHSFCAQCNRLRLTPSGNLKLCLFYDVGIALKPLIRGGASDADLAGAIVQCVAQKPKCHQGMRMPAEGANNQPLIERSCGMYDIGG